MIVIVASTVSRVRELFACGFSLVDALDMALDSAPRRLSRAEVEAVEQAVSEFS